jgi:hypothetical protein
MERQKIERLWPHLYLQTELADQPIGLAGRPVSFKRPTHAKPNFSAKSGDGYALTLFSAALVAAYLAYVHSILAAVFLPGSGPENASLSGKPFSQSALPTPLYRIITLLVNMSLRS